MNILVPNGIPSLSIGGRVFTDVANLIMLYGSCNGVGLGNTTMRKPAASAGYTPSGALTFRALAIRYDIRTGGAAALANILYADADVGVSVVTAFTNAKYPGNDSGLFAQWMGTAQDAQIEMACDFVVPNAKYMCCTNLNSAYVGSIQVWGYEV